MAALILLALNNARKKGKDAQVKSDLQQIRTQAEISYDDLGNYDGVAADADVVTLKADIDSVSGASQVVDSTDAYAAEAQLVSDTAKYFCVDSTGQADTYTGSTIGAADFVCGP